MYNIILKKPAKKFLKKLDKNNQIQIIKKLENLKTNPELGKPLTENLAGLWRLRIDKFRVLYRIKDQQLIIEVLKIGHRKKIY